MFTNEYLQSYSGEHIWYEVWMLFQTGSVLPGGVTSPLIEFVDNAVLESFAIHLRNLLDFFYPDRVTDDDIVAADYYPSGSLPADFPPKSQHLNEAEIRAHKQVSHLTTKRLPANHEGKAWHVMPLMCDMAKIVGVFITTASSERLHPDFATRVRDVLRVATP